MNALGLISRSRLKARLHQTDSWLIVALLALAGWVSDSVRLYVQMHGSWWSDLATFSMHFWYAIPMVAAIIALSKLQPPSKLLGLAAYDERGQRVWGKGSVELDELAHRLAASSVPSSYSHGLHSITLPTGSTLYFLNHGGHTCVLNFSGTASMDQIRHAVEMLQANVPPARFDLLNGLDATTAVLAVSLLQSKANRRVMSFFHHHSRMMVQVQDLAFWTGLEESETVAALEDLRALGLIRARPVDDLTFYELTRDPEILNELDTLFLWRSEWQVQMQRLDQMIGSNDPDWDEAELRIRVTVLEPEALGTLGK